jgi:DNA modification methylase
MEINKLYKGDCLEILKEFPDNSIDAVVTDPPAGISFMGKEFDSFNSLIDFQDFICKAFIEIKRVLKPGGHCLVWAIPRTSHHTAMGLERAGFEIRDCVYHIFGSGFPKSMNIGKAIDKVQGKENSIWEGWGTALKPAVECWWLIRKPISEINIANNVLKWETGGLNIDECRIPLQEEDKEKNKNNWKPEGGYDSTNTIYNLGIKSLDTKQHELGRFPSNLIHDGSDEIMALFPNTQSGSNNIRRKEGFFIEHGKLGSAGDVQISYGDFGSASRFYMNISKESNTNNVATNTQKIEKSASKRVIYVPKASIGEKEKGCKESEKKEGVCQFNEGMVRKNTHPTIKPIALMKYLVKLITPPKGIVLDPFAGSGSTLIAAKELNFKYIGIEKEEEYCKIAEARIDYYNKD